MHSTPSSILLPQQTSETVISGRFMAIQLQVKMFIAVVFVLFQGYWKCVAVRAP